MVIFHSIIFFERGVELNKRNNTRFIVISSMPVHVYIHNNMYNIFLFANILPYCRLSNHAITRCVRGCTVQYGIGGNPEVHSTRRLVNKPPEASGSYDCASISNHDPYNVTDASSYPCAFFDHCAFYFRSCYKFLKILVLFHFILI